MCSGSRLPNRSDLTGIEDTNRIQMTSNIGNFTLSAAKGGRAGTHSSVLVNRHLEWPVVLPYDLRTISRRFHVTASRPSSLPAWGNRVRQLTWKAIGWYGDILFREPRYYRIYRTTKACLPAEMGERGQGPGDTVRNIRAVAGIVTGVSPFLNFRVIHEIAA